MARKHKPVKSAKRSGPRELDPSDAKIGTISTFEDVADEEDEFHLGRDKISLDDYPLPKAHIGPDVFADASDEEVLQLENLPSSDDDEEEEEEDDFYDGDVMGEPRGAGMGMYSDEEISEDEDDKAKNSYGKWGKSTRDYYGGNVAENEGDMELEEEEAAEMIRHQYDGYNEQDFFFDEEMWKTATGRKDDTKDKGQADKEDSMAMDALRVALPEGKEERKKVLYQAYPEFEKMAKDFTTLMPLLDTYKVKLEDGDSMVSSIKHAKFIALSAYLGVLSMYFALMAEERKEGEWINLADHKVMEALKKTKFTWESIKDMDDGDDSEEEVWEEMEEDEEEEERVPLQIEAPPSTNGNSKLVNGLAAVEKLMDKDKVSKAKKRKRLSEEHDPLARRKSSMSSKQVEEGLSDLADLLKQPSKRLKSSLKKPTKDNKPDTDDFTEDTHLHAEDAAEKAKRKKSLRFYTSQIAQRSDKRGRAGRDAGGDMDIPHRERERDRRDRLNAEAQRRGMADAPGVDLDDNDMDEDDLRVGKEVRGEAADNSDEYYDMVASKTKKSKELKKIMYDAEKAGAKVIETEEIDPETGKRAIGYTIQKNKGLTPHRKKDVRNPRVKKRKKYEQAKKKLGSKRAVYKPPTSAYGGEATGIKTKIVKSIKFK